MLAIFKREFKSYFCTPIGYIVLAAFYFFLGLFFNDMFTQPQPIPMVEYVVSQMLIVSVFLMPIITMRLMSEDRRQKVDQALFTAPVKLTAIVLGKFLAAFSLFALCFAPTVIFEIIIMSYAQVNVFTYIYALVGMLLLGAALISIGMFVSCLTESAVVSAIVSLVINVLLIYMSSFAQLIKIEWIAKVFNAIAVIDMFGNFAQEYLSLPDIFYFLSVTAAFLFLCVRVLERRRWA